MPIWDVLKGDGITVLLMASMRWSSPIRPGLATLEAFAAVARLGSFRAAATARGVTPSALSHLIRGLETGLGTRLFHRTTRSLRLTDAGERLLDRIGPALGEIDVALTCLGAAATRPSGRLRLNVPRSAVPLVIAPLLPRFLADYPEVTLEVVGDDRLVDIVSGGFDAGIRLATRLAPGMVAVKLSPRRRFAVVGSPAYLATHGRPRTPFDLSAQACICRRYPAGGRYAWEFVNPADGEVVEIDVDGRIVTTEVSLMRAACVAGAGLAHLFEHDVADLLASGALVRVLEDWCPPLAGFSLYYPSRRHPPAALRAFIDTAREVLSAAQPATGRIG